MIIRRLCTTNLIVKRRSWRFITCRKNKALRLKLMEVHILSKTFTLLWGALSRPIRLFLLVASNRSRIVCRKVILHQWSMKAWSYLPDQEQLCRIKLLYYSICWFRSCSSLWLFKHINIFNKAFFHKIILVVIILSVQPHKKPGRGRSVFHKDILQAFFQEEALCLRVLKLPVTTWKDTTLQPSLHSQNLFTVPLLPCKNISKQKKKEIIIRSKTTAVPNTI